MAASVITLVPVTLVILRSGIHTVTLRPLEQSWCLHVTLVAFVVAGYPHGASFFSIEYLFVDIDPHRVDERIVHVLLDETVRCHYRRGTLSRVRRATQQRAYFFANSTRASIWAFVSAGAMRVRPRRHPNRRMSFTTEPSEPYSLVSANVPIQVRRRLPPSTHPRCRALAPDRVVGPKNA